MSNTASMCTSFMGEILTGTHNFGTAPIRAATTADTFKAALYLSSATYNAGTATNSSATAGVAYWTPSASITYTTVTLATAFNAVLIYNSTQSNKAVAVYTFGDQTITAGTFTLTMPSNITTTALLRLATT